MAEDRDGHPPRGTPTTVSMHTPSDAPVSDQLLQEADRISLERCGASGLIVDERWNIVELMGHVGTYLTPMAGPASLHVTRMLEPTISTTVCTLLVQARHSDSPCHQGEVVFCPQANQCLCVDVVPFQRSQPAGRYFLILFQEQSPAAKQPFSLKKTDQRLEEQVTLLQQELCQLSDNFFRARSRLQALEEEREAYREECDAALVKAHAQNRYLQEQEKKLAQTGDELINLLSSVEIPIVMVDRNLGIRRYVAQAEKLWNLQPEDVGRSLLDIEPGFALPDLEEILRHVMEQMEPCHLELQDDQGKWFALRIRPFVTQDNRVDGATLTAVDIDALKRSMEQEKRIAQEESARKEAEQNQRLKDQYLAMLAHELRNPLTPLQSTLDRLRSRRAEDLESSELLEKADRQLRHLTRLLEDLLEVSRVTQGKISLRAETIDLREAVVQVLEAHEAQVKDRCLHLDVHLAEEPLIVNADPVRLEQIVGNLLRNSIKFTPEAGRIRIHVQSEQDNVVLRIRDTGIGMAPDLVLGAFDLFVQGTGSQQHTSGLGVGLTLVQTLVELHGGTVKAFSEGEGRGSEFVVQLPPGTDKSVPTISAREDGRPQGIVVKTVLLVDDNRAVTESLGGLLQDLGMEVHCAHTPGEALHLAGAHSVDAVLLDLNLSGEDGCELAQRLGQLPDFDPQLWIAISGASDEDLQERARQAGFEHCLVKPVRVDDLMLIPGLEPLLSLR